MLRCAYYSDCTLYSVQCTDNFLLIANQPLVQGSCLAAANEAVQNDLNYPRLGFLWP